MSRILIFYLHVSLGELDPPTQIIHNPDRLSL